MSNKKTRNQNLTIPNLLSVIRIILVPFFAYFFIKGEMFTSAIFLVLSGLSDAVDGYIARHFNQITELGKMLDPLADKITQAAVALCLSIRFPIICPFLIIFIVKELVMLIFASILLKKKRKPTAAKWYGKVSTVLFYISVTTIVVMSMVGVSDMTFKVVSFSMLFVTAVMMLYSAYKYYLIYKELIKSDDPSHAIDLQKEITGRK